MKNGSQGALKIENIGLLRGSIKESDGVPPVLELRRKGLEVRP